MKELIQKLVEVVAPSGREGAVRDLVQAELRGLVDEIRVDPLGNLIARKGQQGSGGCRVMIAAHLDEIGLMATHIDENGFIRFNQLGVLRLQSLLGSRVRFTNGVAGVIHSERLEHPNATPSLENLFIDVGATSREDCPVRVGDSAGFERPLWTLGNRLVAKSMDNRISVAVLIETLRRLENSPHEIYAVFSVQEEVGVRGATTAAFAVDPEVGLAIDVCPVGDTPKGNKIEVALGKGPAIKLRDTGMVSDPRVVNWMVTAAERLEMPFQWEILEGGSTDARAMQISRAGVLAGCLSIPCRYVHTASEMVDFGDVEASVRLLVEMLAGPIELA